MEIDVERGVTRREALRRGGLGLGVLAVGGGVAGTAAARRTRIAAPNAKKTIKVGWGGAACEAPLYAAHEAGLFERAGLDVQLVKLGLSTGTNQDALASGKIDAAPGILYQWLKPIEQGLDVKLAAGLHGGCLRLVGGNKAGIKRFSDLKGKTIGTDSIGGSAMSYFAVVLVEHGIDPVKDVTWKAISPTLLTEAVKKGEIQAIVAPDPFPTQAVLAGVATEIASNITGAAHDHFCCTASLRGGFVRDEPELAKRLVQTWMAGSRYVGSHVRQVAGWEVTKKYVPASQGLLEQLLGSYVWKPSASKLKADLIQGARNFKRTGILDKGTDPNTLARTAYVNLFGRA